MTIDDVTYDAFDDLGSLPVWTVGGVEYAFCSQNHKLYTVKTDNNRKALVLYQRNVSDLESAILLTA